MESLVIEGKNYISSKRAAELMGYTQDYIGQLARSGKISAERVSGVWYVNEEEFSGLSNKKDKLVDDLSNQNKSDIGNEFNTEKKTKIAKSKTNITLDGIDYISSKRAAQIMGYTQDYIGQLCRSGKIEARQIGRGWYIPESVVQKTVEEKQKIVMKEVPKKELPTEEVAKREVLGGILEFKKEEEHIVQTPVQIKKTEEIKIESKKVEVKPSIKHIESKTKQKKEEYYYPSFLNATYTTDKTPLVPTPKRSREPILHQIVRDEKDTSENNVAIRRIPTNIVDTPKIQEPTLDSNKVHKITEDILRPQKQELIKRSPLSLMKIASVGMAVLLFASAVTFVPSISVFNSDTGVLKTVISLKLPQNDTLKAQAVTSVSNSSLIERFLGVLAGYFEDEIEYKAK